MDERMIAVFVFRLTCFIAILGHSTAQNYPVYIMLPKQKSKSILYQSKKTSARETFESISRKKNNVKEIWHLIFKC